MPMRRRKHDLKPNRIRALELLAGCGAASENYGAPRSARLAPAVALAIVYAADKKPILRFAF
jgi:hypothetical protein